MTEAADPDSKPKYLYKYYSVRWAESLLANGQIFFPCVADFNDPFDCKTSFTFRGPRRTRERYERELIKEKAPHLSRNQRHQMAKVGASERTYRIANDKLMKRIEKQAAILSLSEKYDNLLMWAHYADKHAGLCVEFECQGDLRTSAMRVRYSEQYPELDVGEVERAREKGGLAAAETERRVVELMYLTKSKDWEYEREWRVLDLKGRGLRSANLWRITRVILGCRMPRADKDKLKSWIQRPVAPTILQAQVDTRAYRLDFIEV
jgi:DUF2971 family protein